MSRAFLLQCIPRHFFFLILVTIRDNILDFCHCTSIWLSPERESYWLRVYVENSISRPKKCTKNYGNWTMGPRKHPSGARRQIYKRNCKVLKLGSKEVLPHTKSKKRKEREEKYSRTKRIECWVLDETGVSIFSRHSEIWKDPLVDVWQLGFRTKGPREKHRANVLGGEGKQVPHGASSLAHPVQEDEHHHWSLKNSGMQPRILDPPKLAFR